MPSISSKSLDPSSLSPVGPPSPGTARIDTIQSSPTATGPCGPPTTQACEAGLQLSTELSPLGKAQTSLALASNGDDPAAQAWKQAAKGSKIELKPKADSKIGHLMGLIDHVTESKSLTDAQKTRIKSFLKAFPAEFAPKDPQAQARSLKILDELIQAGITKEQLSLIGDGKFSTSDLVRLLRDNPGPSLVGWNPAKTKTDGFNTDGRQLQQMFFGAAASEMPRATAIDSTSAPKPIPEQPKAPHPRESRPPSPDG